MIQKIHLSVVSHGQGHLVHQLLNDIKSYCVSGSVYVTLTLNINETLPFLPDSFPFSVRVITNSAPKGFGANHNYAFHQYQQNSSFFCVVNPDIRLNHNPFPALIAGSKSSEIGLIAPVVLNKEGDVEDSARFFPTPFKILCKVLGRCKGSDYVIRDATIFPDWVGGMFMFFPCEIFDKLNGFDERYFLYYEDVDICGRLRLLGYDVALCPAARVIHDAQRSSHKSLKYLKWHLASMLRFFCSKVFLFIFWKKFKNIFSKGGSV